MLTVLLHNYLACLLIRVGCIVITCDSDIIKMLERVGHGTEREVGDGRRQIRRVEMGEGI